MTSRNLTGTQEIREKSEFYKRPYFLKHHVVSGLTLSLIANLHSYLSSPSNRHDRITSQHSVIMQRRSANGQAKPLEPLSISSGDADNLKKRSFAVSNKLTKEASENLSWILTFSFLVCCVLSSFYYFQIWQAQQEQKFEQRLQAELDPMTRDWEERILALKEENGKLLNSTLRPESTLIMTPGHEQDVQAMRIKKLSASNVHLQRAIQELSKREVIEKFGPGPHRVEIQLDFDPADPIPGTEDRIIIELASIDEMPHTVCFFLSQVDKELFNGCSFHRNAGHVIQAGPAPNFKTPLDANLVERFKKSKLESVAFQEYSAKYPHVPYTLGFAGRPGGPDFYISVVDNSKIHGPGGQSRNDDLSEADPCFATVIEGRDTVDRMVKAAVQPGTYKHMVHNINIRSMKIVNYKKQ